MGLMGQNRNVSGTCVCSESSRGEAVSLPSPASMSCPCAYVSVCVCWCVCACWCVRVCLAARSYLTLQPQGLYPVRLLCPQDFPSKNTGVGSHSLLQGIFLTQGSNPGLLHCRRFLYLGRQGSPALYPDALYPDSLVLYPPDLLSHAL